MTGQCVIGVDLGGTKIYTALADKEGKILSEIKVPTEAHRGKEHVIKLICDTVAEVQRQAGAAGEVLAVGIGAPGPLDARQGVIHFAPNLQWRDVPIKAILEKELNLPVAVDNDANLAALGEYVYGAGRGTQHMVYVTVSTGVGAGLILKGELYHGVGFGAGEIGHMIVDPGGPRCGCGNYGCLEALASGTAMAREARRLVETGAGAGILAEAGSSKEGAVKEGAVKEGAIEEGTVKEAITAEVLGRAAARGDGEAVAILNQAGSALGIGLANVINLLNPEVIVLGGGALGVGRPLWEAMEREVDCRSVEASRRQVRIVKAELDGLQGLMGAIALAIRRSTG